MLFIVGSAGCILPFDDVGPREGGGGSGATSAVGGEDVGGSGGLGGDGGAVAIGGGVDGGGGSNPIVDCEVATDQCSKVPEGFDGPFLFAESSAACAVMHFRGGFVRPPTQPWSATPAQCDCHCVPQNETCAPNGVAVHGLDTCQDVTLPASVSAGDCLTADADSIAASFQPTTTATGVCGTDNGGSSKSLVTFDQPMFGCSVAFPSCLVDGHCIPDDSERYCVTTVEPSVPCPQGFDGSEEIIVREGVNFLDDRACSCNCGGYSGSCAAGVEIFADSSCDGTAAPAEGDASCLARQDGGSIGAFRYVPSSTSTCSTMSVVTGTVLQVNETRMCCNR